MCEKTLKRAGLAISPTVHLPEGNTESNCQSESYGPHEVSELEIVDVDACFIYNVLYMSNPHVPSQNLP